MTKMKHIRRLLGFCLTVFIFNCRHIKVDSSSPSGHGRHNVEDKRHNVEDASHKVAGERHSTKDNVEEAHQNEEDASHHAEDAPQNVEDASHDVEYAPHNVEDATDIQSSREHVLRSHDFNPENDHMQDPTNLISKDKKGSKSQKNDEVSTSGMETMFSLPDIKHMLHSSESSPSTSMSTIGTEVGKKYATVLTTPQSESEVQGKRDMEKQQLRSIIIENLPITCPTGLVCRNESFKYPEPGYRHCCYECSCEPGCNLGNQSCCFEENVVKKQTKYDGTECNFLTTSNIKYSQRHNFALYKMISNCSDLSIKEVSMENSCGTKNIVPWGSLYPVFSKSSGKIYKNSECALCNGITDGEVWDVEMVCDIYASDGRWQNIANFESYFNGYNPDNLCYVNFKPPVMFSLLGHLRCVQDPISDCPDDDFAIPNGVSMSKSEVRRACSSGFTSFYPMFGAFKNVFCHICNKKPWPKERYCMALLTYPRGDFIYKFSTLLTKDFLRQVYREKHLNKQLPLACMLTKGLKKVCRKIFCPDGMTYDGRGNCIYPTSRWNVETYRLILRLVPETVIENAYITASIMKGPQSSDTYFDPSKLIAPFPKTWILQMLSYKTKADDSDIVDHFLAFVNAYSLPKNPSVVLEAVKRYMKRKWFLLVNGTRVGLSVEFSGMRHYWLYNKTIKPNIYTTINDTIPLDDFKWPLLYEFISMLQKSSSVTITKMFYCSQIALRKDEYVLEHNGNVLWYNNTVYLDGEFSYVIDTETDTYVPRICIDNSGFIRQHLNGVNSQRSLKNLVLALAIVVDYALVMI